MGEGASGAEMAGRLGYTAAELARAFGLTRHAIYSAIARGELRASKVCGGSRFVIPAGAAEEWLERHRVTPQATPRFDARMTTGRAPVGPLGVAMRELERRAAANGQAATHAVS